jgi:hypothetical protein
VMKLPLKIVYFDTINGDANYTLCVFTDTDGDVASVYIGFMYTVALRAEGETVYRRKGTEKLWLEPTGSSMSALCPGSFYGVFTVTIPRRRLIKAFMQAGWKTPLNVDIDIIPHDYTVLILREDGTWFKNAYTAPNGTIAHVDDPLTLSDIEPRWWETIHITLGWLIHRVMNMFKHR